MSVRERETEREGEVGVGMGMVMSATGHCGVMTVGFCG